MCLGGRGNAEEMREHTNPCDRDSDNDGVGDGEETIGTVASFVEDSAHPGTGVLTITLKDNSTVSGKVDSTTEIECRAPEQTTTPAPGSNPKDGSDEGGDHHGDGGDEGDHHGDEHQCSTADLTAGTPVHEAELHGSGDQAVFEKVKLLK